MATSALRDLVRPAAATVPAGDDLLPVAAALADVLPRGLRRGTTVAVAGSTSLLLDLLAGPSAGGAWSVVVGMPTLGLLAADHAGVALDRLALIPDPGQHWPTVVAVLVDAFDVVVVAPPVPVRAGDARKLAARLRRSRSLLVTTDPAWPQVDLRLDATSHRWEGLGNGHGRLSARALEIEVSGRGAAAVVHRARLKVA